jgi:creatinine amidohydrolase
MIHRLAELTTDKLRDLLEADEPVVVLVPTGCVEPHGPHLPLETDTIISEAAAERAVPALEEAGWRALIAPAVGYGTTECGAAFAGAVSVAPDTLTAMLNDIVGGLLADGVDQVCLVNNHLEPEHDGAVRAAADGFDEAASVATPLKRKWARTLSEEFKRGECHAGKYETSIVLAAAPDRVDRQKMAELEEVPVSLSEKLREGVSDFAEMGMADAYAGAPAEATAAHGDQMLDRLADIIVGEVDG